MIEIFKLSDKNFKITEITIVKKIDGNGDQPQKLKSVRKNKIDIL